jgi:flagellar biosynthesis protein FlhG
MNMRDTKPYVITFCSGKSGVGKSIIAANTANELARNGTTTAICDLNLNSPTLHLFYGIEPLYKWQDCIDNPMLLDKIAYPLKDRLLLVAGSTSPSPALSPSDVRKSLERIISNIAAECIIFDCNSGAESEILECCRASDQVIMVLTDAPSSVIDTYGLLKIIQSYAQDCRISLLINNVIDSEDADDTSMKLNQATTHFLSAEYSTLGFIPYDRAVRSSILQQKLLRDSAPLSEATVAIEAIAKLLREAIETNSVILSVT